MSFIFKTFDGFLEAFVLVTDFEFPKIQSLGISLEFGRLLFNTVDGIKNSAKVFCSNFMSFHPFELIFIGCVGDIYSIPPKEWRFCTHNLKVPSLGESLQ